MVDLNPPRAGGRIRLTPTADGGYQSERLPLEDPLEGATEEEREFFRANFHGKPLVELLRRLRWAEWNTAEARRQADQWRDAARRTEEQLAKAMAIVQANPPDGYTMPAAAQQLLEHAEAHGWQTKVVWTPPDYQWEPHVKVAVGHAGWRYELTWHSRDCQPGRVRLFSGLAWTPDRPAPHDAPSVKQIRAVIETNPATTHTEAA